MNSTGSGRKKKLLEVIAQPFKRHKTQKAKRPNDVVSGNFSLRAIRGSRFPGHQTAATALCALLQARCLSPSSWSPEVIDRLLLQGDKLHSLRISHLYGHNGGNGYLSPDDLPRSFHTKQGELTITVSSVEHYGSCYDDFDKQERKFQHEFCGLKNSLNRCLLENHSTFLLTVEGVTVAIYLDGRHSYVFHPSLEKRKVFSSSRYEAVLLHFYSLGRMCAFLCSSIFCGSTHFSLRAVGILSDQKLQHESRLSKKCEE